MINKTSISITILFFQVHQALLTKLLRSSETCEDANSQRSSESASISDLVRDINQHYGMGDAPSGPTHSIENGSEKCESIKSESNHSNATRSSFADPHQPTQNGNYTTHNQVGNYNGINGVNGVTNINGVNNGFHTNHYSSINMPSMQHNQNLLQEADMRQTYDTVLSWNSSTMQPTEQSLLTSLSKLRSNPTPELIENLKLRQKILLEICKMVMNSSGKTVDYATRAMDAICKRQIDQNAGISYNFCLTNLIEGNQPKNSETGEISQYNDSQMDAAYTAAIHTPWPDCFNLLIGKLKSNINALKLFADRIKMKCENYNGNSIQDENWIKKIAEPLCELCNSDQSTVRKNAIFSIVELYRQVGEEKLRALLVEKLQPSKLKLVNLYISRMTK